MKERRRGLGRGLGALIPTSSEGERPVDVFFPAAASAGESQETSVATIDRPADAAETDADVSRETDAPNAGPTEHPEGDAGDTRNTSAASVDDGTVEDPEPTVAGEASESDVPTATPGADQAEGEAIAASDAALETVNEADVAPASTSEGASESDSPVGAAEATTAPPNDVTGANTAGEVDGDAVTPHSPEQMPTDEAQPADDATEPSADGLVPVPGASFAELPVANIRPNPRQPRTVFDEGELDELVGSIKEIGVLQPVVVRPLAEEPGQYELIMGERRWRATQAAGLDAIPAIIRVTDDEDLLRDALLENLHRSALNPLEEAAAYRQLLDDFGCTHDELATRISRSRPQISNTLRLLRLPPLVQRRVAAGVLSAGHARALLGLSDGAAIERLAQRIVSEGLSVRATEEIVALGMSDEKAPARRPRAGQRSEAVDALASRLSDRFETRVKVDLGKSKGRVTIEFASVEDLNRILDVMAPEDPGLLRR